VPGGNGQAPQYPAPDEERRRDRLPAVPGHAAGGDEGDGGTGTVKRHLAMRNAACGMRHAKSRVPNSRIPHSFVFRLPSSAFLIATAIALAAVATAVAAGAQSLSYTKGQNVAPAYEGWEQDANGAKYFLFGYMNRNWEEEIDVPVGPDNSFNIGGADQGQPTHFLPRRNRFIFRVRVPATFGEKDELVWTLTSHGKTEKAYATLRPDYIVDDVVKASETGALGAGTS